MRNIKTIKKGRTELLEWPSFMVKPTNFIVEFGFSQSVYALNEPKLTKINKIGGVSFEIFPKIRNENIIKPHHYNSVRTGFSVVNDQIDIWVYYYKQGERIWKKLHENASPIETYLCYFDRTEDNINVRLESKFNWKTLNEFEINLPRNPYLGYKLGFSLPEPTYKDVSIFSKVLPWNKSINSI